MRNLKLIMLVLLIQAGNAFCTNDNLIEIYSNRDLTESVKYVLINDTIFIKYSLSDTSLKSIKIIFSKNSAVKEIICNNISGDTSFVFNKEYFDFNQNKEPFVDIDLYVKAGNSAYLERKVRLVYEPFELLSISREKINKAKVNDKMYIKSYTDDNYEGRNVYINEVPIDKLKAEEMGNNYYYFFINERLANNDSLSKIFNPQHEGKINVALGIGINDENIKIISDDFSLIFDVNKGCRKHFSIISMILIIVIAIYVFFNNSFAILRDQSDLTDPPPFSLSRTQMAFWSIIIVTAFFVVWYNTGNIVRITPDVLVLLGISAVTAVGAQLIDKSDINNPNITKRHQDGNNANNFLLDILSDNKGLSIHRFQNVAFTIAIGCYFLYEVFKEFKIPDLDNNLMVLMGISSGTYLTIKKGENNQKQ